MESLSIDHEMPFVDVFKKRFPLIRPQRQRQSPQHTWVVIPDQRDLPIREPHVKLVLKQLHQAWERNGGDQPTAHRRHQLCIGQGTAKIMLRLNVNEPGPGVGKRLIWRTQEEGHALLRRQNLAKRSLVL